MSATSLITPRRGAAIARIAVDSFDGYYVGLYRGQRDAWLLAAHTYAIPNRADCIRHAIGAHRRMMRCLIAPTIADNGNAL